MIFLNQLSSNKSESNTVIPAKIKKQTVSSSEEIVSTLPYSVSNGCAVVYQNEIHLMGTSYSISDPKNHYKWDGSTWTSISTLPFKLNGDKASIVYNDEIHLFGHPSYHYKWNGSTWKSVGDSPCEITENYSVIVHNNEIHLISRNNKHYKFDGTTWTKVSVPPMVLNSFRVVSCKNKIHVLGAGTDAVGHYTWDGSRWEKLADLPYYFHSGVAIVYNDEIHIIGTSNSDHWCDHYKWVNDTTWTLIGTVSLKVCNATSVVYNGGINILGGSGDPSTFTRHSMLAEGVSITDCISIHSKNSNVYSTNFVESGDHFTIPIDTIGDNTHIFVYNKDNTKLLYTNQTITYNQDTSKYEIYGYFPSTLKGTTVPITSDGWQTLQLDTPKLFN